MDDFYLKYESQYRTQLNYTDVKEVLSKWVMNLNKEIDVISSFDIHYNTVNELNGLKLFFSSLIDIFKQFEEYLIELEKGIGVLPIMKEDNDDYDMLVNSLFSFLKDNYNSILILIEQFYSLNRSLIQIRHDFIKSIKGIHYNPISITITMTQSQLDQLIICNKDIRESQLRQANSFIKLKDKGYPSIKEINRLSDQITKGNKRVDINHYDKHYGMKGLGVNVTQCRDICLEIQDNLNKYCVCYSHPQAKNDTKVIKADNNNIEDKLTSIKSDVKNYIKSLKEINERIDKFNKENKTIISFNNDKHMKINGQRLCSNENNEYAIWKTPKELLPRYSHNSNKENTSMMLFNSKFLTQTPTQINDNHYNDTETVKPRFLLKRID